jgi:hypothetical protein
MNPYIGKVINKIQAPLIRFFGGIYEKDLCVFTPASAGGNNIMMPLTLLSANQTFLFLKGLVDSVNNKSRIYTVKEFSKLFNKVDDGILDELKNNFIKYGSDKASTHNYYLIYACVLDQKNASALLEIGLGTNNVDIASNMGENGSPGASLRAFRDFLPFASIYGADIDKRILFKENRIKTFFVDQTNPETFDQLGNDIDDQFDLIIDDGLHAPNANIATLIFALPNLKKGGWFIIEDIPERAIDLWHVVSAILPKDTYNSYIIKTQSTHHVFACQKKY